MTSLALAYLGPEGSHSHAAALGVANHPVLQRVGLQPVAYRSLRAVIAAVNSGEVPLALLPAENALEGSIAETLEGILVDSEPDGPHILLECGLPVQHALIQAQPGDVSGIRHVVSHPQALAQCRETLAARFGDTLQLHAATATSEAVASLHQRPAAEQAEWAAIGTAAAAQQYGCKVIAANMSDSETNQTRFWLVANAKNELPSLNLTSFPCKTSLCIGLTDRPGVLVDLLLVFKAYGLTMTRIESRSARRQLGDYLFFIDVAADLHVPEHDRVRMYLQADSTFFRMSTRYASLGVLPAAG